MAPADYEFMCPRDLALVAKGFDMRTRGEWSRTLLLANMWSSKPITYDDLIGTRKPTKNQIKSKEEWEQFKEQFRDG